MTVGAIILLLLVPHSSLGFPLYMAHIIHFLCFFLFPFFYSSIFSPGLHEFYHQFYLEGETEQYTPLKCTEMEKETSNKIKGFKIEKAVTQFSVTTKRL